MSSEIVKGLAAGDRVLLTNLLRVRSGAPVVEITPAQPNDFTPEHK